MAALDLTQHARDGFNESYALRPAYDSSPAGMAFLAGMAHKIAGQSIPAKANMSRGYSVRIRSYRNVNIVYDTARFPSFREMVQRLEDRVIPSVPCFGALR